MLKTRSINLQGSELPNYLAFEIIYMYRIMYEHFPTPQSESHTGNLILAMVGVFTPGEEVSSVSTW